MQYKIIGGALPAVTCNLLVARDVEHGVQMKTTEEAWADFEKHYMPRSSQLVNPSRSNRWLRRTIASAAIITALVMVPFSVHALGAERMWNAVTRWAKETFSFIGSNVVNPDEPDSQYRELSYELRDLLISCKHRGDIVPTWVPDGFEFEKVEQDITPVQEIYRARYVNGEKKIRIRVQTCFDEDIQNTEATEGWQDVYIVNDIKYYIVENLEQLQVLWIVDNYECSISGNLTVDEAKQMIDSIYEGD